MQPSTGELLSVSSHLRSHVIHNLNWYRKQWWTCLPSLFQCSFLMRRCKMLLRHEESEVIYEEMINTSTQRHWGQKNNAKHSKRLGSTAKYRKWNSAKQKYCICKHQWRKKMTYFNLVPCCIWIISTILVVSVGRAGVLGTEVVLSANRLRLRCTCIWVHILTGHRTSNGIRGNAMWCQCTRIIDHHLLNVLLLKLVALFLMVIVDVHKETKEGRAQQAVQTKSNSRA